MFYTQENVYPDPHLGCLIKKTAQSLAQEVERRMNFIGISEAQYKPLLLLKTGKCATAADIARFVNHDTGTITRILDRLEDKGAVRRVRSDADRRVVLLQLTKEGDEIAGQVPVILAEVMNQALRGFSIDEFDSFLTFLERIVGNLDGPQAMPEAASVPFPCN